LGNGPSATPPPSGVGSSAVSTVAAPSGTPTGPGNSPPTEAGVSGGAASGLPPSSTGAQPALGTDAPPSAAQLRLIGGAAATAVPGAQVAGAGAGLGTADVAASRRARIRAQRRIFRERRCYERRTGRDG